MENKKGNLEEGYKELQYALKLDGENPSIFYHIGLYFEESRDFKQALSHLHKAKEMGLIFHGIDLKNCRIRRNS